MQNKEYHPEYSSLCMCGFCQINKEVADRIRGFVKSKGGRWSEKRLAWRRNLILGRSVSPKNNTQLPNNMPTYNDIMKQKQKPNYYKALQIAAAMTKTENQN